MNSRIFAIFSGLAVVLCSGLAHAATVSGKISDSNGAGLASMEVRLWSQGAKRWSIAATEVTAADGTYSFANVPAGDYKLDARMSPGVDGNYGDTWYDVAAPTANGLVGADADILSLGASDTLTGMNLTLPVLGGLDGRIVEAGTPVQGLAVRAESKMDHRIHHEDDTDGPCCGTNPHLGKFFFRGLAPSTSASNYRLLVYDPAGVYATTVLPGPFTVTSNTNANAGDLSIQRIGPDPNEPNDASTDPGTATITAFPYVPANVALAPRDDVDWYCLNALAGERYVATVTAKLTVEGMERRHPWFDPMVGLWNGSQIVLSNDDAAPGQSWDAALDTNQLPADGRYCFVVTTFGDADFNGSGAGSAGEYQMEIALGNRPPTLDVTYEAQPVPIRPMEIIVDEDVTMVFTMDYSDPDGDALAVEVRHDNANGMPVTAGMLVEMANQATYTWTPTQTDAAVSPFELTFRINDGEFDLRLPVVVRVAPVSVPPTIPVLIEPIGDATVATTDVDLVLENSTDADGDPLSYEYQVEFGEPDGTPEHEATETQDASGQTSTTVTALEENTWVSWRARSYDGAEYSAWSEWEQFFVDTGNDPPDAPTIVKPAANAELTERQPTIAATIPADPEGSAVTVTFELSASEGFGDVLSSSDALEPGTDAMMIEWLVDQLLEPGNVYFTRAFATDAEGAQSAYSDVVAFSIRHENELLSPSFSGEFAACEPVTLDAVPTEVQVLNFDSQGGDVTFEVSIVRADAPDQVLVEADAAQSEGTETIIELAAIEPTPGDYLLRVRALRGMEVTNWTECTFTIGGDDSDGDTTGGREKEGCGCGTTRGFPAPFLILAAAFVLTRRRRRR